MEEKKTGYELSVIGQFYHFFGIVFGNHYYLDSQPNTRKPGLQTNSAAETGTVEFIEQNYTAPLTLKQLIGLRIHVTQILLPFFFRDDPSDAYGLSKPAAY